jgi:hypothetical protein
VDGGGFLTTLGRARQASFIPGVSKRGCEVVAIFLRRLIFVIVRLVMVLKFKSHVRVSPRPSRPS